MSAAGNFSISNLFMWNDVIDAKYLRSDVQDPDRESQVGDWARELLLLPASLQRLFPAISWLGLTLLPFCPIGAPRFWNAVEKWIAGRNWVHRSDLKSWPHKKGRRRSRIMRYPMNTLRKPKIMLEKISIKSQRYRALKVCIGKILLSLPECLVCRGSTTVIKYISMLRCNHSAPT